MDEYGRYLAFAGPPQSHIREREQRGLFVRLGFSNRGRETVNTYLQGRKIDVEPARQCPPAEILHLIRKLRWIGMEEEAEQLQLKMQKTTPAGGVITVVRETD